jgi:anti-sigma factor RsiW
MTNFSDETLMAFADEELDPVASAAVAAAMRDDPEIQKRVAKHRALRTRLRLAYSADVEQAPPERLLIAARGLGVKAAGVAPASKVSNLADARAANAARSARSGTTRSRWRPIAAMAASLVVGVGLGYLGLRHSDSIVAGEGGLVASGPLANALSNQVGGGAPVTAAVQVGLSFLSKSGDYCRVFNMAGAAAPAGVACHQKQQWRIQVLAQRAEPAVGEPSGNFRTASSDLSPAVLNTVQQEISGEALDQAAEVAARQRGWQPAAH